MCALQFASESMGQHKQENKDDEKEVHENIQYLTLLIDEYLAKEDHSQ